MRCKFKIDEKKEKQNNQYHFNFKWFLPMYAHCTHTNKRNSVYFLFSFSAMDEKSSSDDENENYDNVMFTPEDEEVQNLAMPGEFVFHRFGGNVDDLAQSSNDDESCSSHDNSSDESDEYYNHSDYEEKFSSSSNKSDASNAESADTTHSYSNSLLEDEEDNNGGAITDSSDFETDEQYEDAHLVLPNVKIEQIPNFSDFNNGTFKRWSF